MVPHSVIISIMPPYQFGPFFQTLSFFTQIHYISLFNTTEEVTPDCKKYYNSIGEIAFHYRCHYYYYDVDSYVQPGILYSQLVVAKDYIHMKKYNKLLVS